MDENPYKTPEADVTRNEEFSRSVWWKIYFVFYLLLIIASMPDILLSDGVGAWDVVYFLIFIPAAIGLFGHVFSKKY